MSESAPIPVVFDCTVLAQALMNPRGPAGACLSAAQRGQVKLFVSDYVLQEVRELPDKLPVRLGATLESVESLIQDLAKYAEFVASVPAGFVYPRDQDDAHYVDLAIACGAYLIASRDNDLLDLMNDSNAEGWALRARYPMFRVITPPALLGLIARPPRG